MQFLISLPVTILLLFLLHLGPLNQPPARALFYGVFWGLLASLAITLRIAERGAQAPRRAARVATAGRAQRQPRPVGGDHLVRRPRRRRDRDEVVGQRLLGQPWQLVLADADRRQRLELELRQDPAHRAHGAGAVAAAVVGLVQRVGDALELRRARSGGRGPCVSASTSPIVSPCGRPNSPPSAWPSECSEPQSEMFIASPASRLEQAMSDRGRRHPSRRGRSAPATCRPAASTRGRSRRRSACGAVTTSPAIAWASASMPV